MDTGGYKDESASYMEHTTYWSLTQFEGSASFHVVTKYCWEIGLASLKILKTTWQRDTNGTTCTFRAVHPVSSHHYIGGLAHRLASCHGSYGILAVKLGATQQHEPADNSRPNLLARLNRKKCKHVTFQFVAYRMLALSSWLWHSLLFIMAVPTNMQQERNMLADGYTQGVCCVDTQLTTGMITRLAIPNNLGRPFLYPLASSLYPFRYSLPFLFLQLKTAGGTCMSKWMIELLACTAIKCSGVWSI
jgi:hypothetical protein